MPSLYIGTPAYGSMVTLAYLTSLIKTMNYFNKKDITVHNDFIGNESLITRARNNIVARFLESKATHLLFIDADITWEPEHIQLLLDNDKDINGGIYPLKRYEFESNLQRALEESNGNIHMFKSKLVNYAVNNLDGQKELHIHDGIAEVKHIATGFMMIKRNVFEKLIKEYPKMKLKQNSNMLNLGEKYLYNFFDTDVDKQGYYLSEDYAFCKRAKNIGFKIYANVKIPLSHTGTNTFEGHYGLSLLKGSESLNKS